jgi:hypothetical protein
MIWNSPSSSNADPAVVVVVVVVVTGQEAGQWGGRNIEAKTPSHNA